VGIGTFFASLEAIMGTFMWALLITVLGRKYLNPQTISSMRQNSCFNPNISSATFGNSIIKQKPL